jgi:PAS domain S-box-containing protein
VCDASAAAAFQPGVGSFVMNGQGTPKIGDEIEAGLAGFLDMISLGFFRSSLEGRLIYGNRALVRMFGFDSLETMKRFPLVRLYADKTDRGRLIRSLIESGAVEEHRIDFRQRGGHLIRCSVTAAGHLDDDGNLVFIDGVVRDVSFENERLGRERLQGVLEMAGGVVHRLNQPLTVVNNLLSELISDMPEGSDSSAKLRQMQEQVRKINDIAKKIGNIRKYKSMDYVAGVRIVDIDSAS